MLHLINRSPEGQHKMKNLLTTLIASGLLAFGSTANGAFITDVGGAFDGVNVGDVDGLIIQQTVPGNSNPTTELAWADTYISGDAVFVEKTELVTYYSTTADNIFAFKLASDAPDYFIVKNASERALFRNATDFGWGVFDASLFTTIEVCHGNSECKQNQLINLGNGDFEISHVTEINGTDRSLVPIPAAAWLFGSGLIGLVAVGRRKVTDNNA